MIYFFRMMVVFVVVYLAYLISSGFGAGMEPVWVFVLIVCFGLSLRKVYKAFFGQTWLKRLFWLGMALVLFVEGAILVSAFEDHSEDTYDYVLVLGAGLLGDRISLTLKYRLDVAYEYLQAHPETMAVLSGGQGPGENMTEALAMEGYLVAKGIEPSRLIQEDQSTSTRENIAYTYEIFQERGEEAPAVLVVSSRFHLLRAKRIAKEAGHQVDAIGAKTLQYLIPNYYFREMFAVIVEYIR